MTAEKVTISKEFIDNLSTKYGEKRADYEFLKRDMDFYLGIISNTIKDNDLDEEQKLIKVDALVEKFRVKIK